MSCVRWGVVWYIIEPSHKSHNAWDKHTIFTTLQRKCAPMCTFRLQNGTLWDVELMRSRVYATGLLEKCFNGYGNKKLAITMRFIYKEISSEDWWQYQAWQYLFIPGKGCGLCGIPHPLSYATFNTIGLTNFGAKTPRRCLLSTGCNIHSNVSKSTFYEVSKFVAWSMGDAHEIAIGSAVTKVRRDHEYQ